MQMNAKGLQVANLRVEVQERFTREMEVRVKGASWVNTPAHGSVSSGSGNNSSASSQYVCHSWYYDSERDSHPHLFTGSVIEFMWRTRKARLSDFECNTSKGEVQPGQLIKEKRV